MAFHIALNMAGAVSAGAYTAGVLDFLIEALDEWYDARESQRAAHGSDIASWNIPAHEVMLDVMSGASAGGMCAAMSAVALREEFDHVHQTSVPDSLPVNRLYAAWVRSIDILPLLGTDDLASGLRSILDSTRIEAIADEQLQFQGGRAQRRDWIADPLQVILTLSNLRGVPYSVDQANAGSFEERIASHADRIEFAIGSGFTDFATLRLAAMATGAFPLMLASRAIMRAKADYQNLLKIAPDWGGPAPDRFPNVYADGGITNNNPFQCAHDALVAAAGNIGQNPRDPANANAAVISVAPFPGDERFDASYDPAKESALVNVAAAVAHTLISQTRFQGEDLLLTRDESVSSRFAIAPSDDTAGDRPALLCGSLGAFGGFVDQKFRDRDYQLGRYNCQEFLRRVFAVTADNVIVGPGAKKKPEMQAAFDAEYSFVEDGKRWYPVIPLMPGLRQKIALPGRDAFKTSDERLEQVASAAANRLRAVLHAVLREPWLFLEGAIFDLGGSHKVKGLILEKLKNELGRVGQI